jgi:beta-lactam-binding protein with PASTA domain
MPDVVNSAQADAESQLTRLGLTTTVTQQADDTVAEGNVISTNPEAGAQLTVGTSVTLVVSTGSDAAVVPDVSGKTQEEARAALTAVGLSVGDVTTGDSPTVDKGEVISTDPAAQASVPKGSAVALTIASGKVTVPDVTGKPLADAVKQLRNLGLSTNSTETTVTTDADPGTVVTQDVSPDSSVDVRTLVNLTVAPERTATETPTTSPTGSPTSSGSPSSSPTSSGSQTGAVGTPTGDGNDQ